MSNTPVIIIGAGLTGLTCARQLSDRGVDSILLDKGRGIGGRLSTRRGDGVRFDHGAQYITPDDPAFRALLEQAEREGAAARLADKPESFVGLPGMTGLAKFVGRDLDVRQNIRVETLRPSSAGWDISWDGGGLTANRVVVTVPVPQAIDLLVETSLSSVLDQVRMDPCLTLMLAAEAEATFSMFRDPDADIAWIARDSSKPGRPGTSCWVAQASADFSRRHLELGKDEIAEIMLPLVAAKLGLTSKPTYLSAHRWRYALTARPLGQSHLQDETGTLFVGGDWCLGASAEDAWQSGRALAEAIVAG